ncbi:MULTISPECIES: S9 family peptidase [Pseudoalteromonas]|uniref:Acylaminoacyl-peptidase n=1 Tax=Pseudoalteromonas amylolytica TaxID=1859457 RepID=A0A1S1MMM4_9GAMM|nr:MULTISPECIES: prolyl oligopeptidase family serine peptidase [Pseudoalteromonas]OHU86242.1 acylaminoacyl-peptidase [Pseudoalteromonas sp. JW3]OHU89653.1 acylaminoacyl-peptidase [Pseudoalteromonas amylolytica]
MKPIYSLLSASILLAGSAHTLASSEKQPLEFKDVFDFRYAQDTVLSENGQFLSFSAQPYRGDNSGHVYDLTTNELIAQVPRGVKPHINKSATWVAFTQTPSLLTQETASKEEKKKLPSQLVLVNTQTKQQQTFDNVVDYQLSNDGTWLAYREKADNSKLSSDNSKNKDDSVGITSDKKDKAYELVIINLNNGNLQRIQRVGQYSLSPTGLGVLFNQLSDDGSDNRISFVELNNSQQHILFDEPGITLSRARWHPDGELIAFYQGNYVNNDVRRRHYQLTLWDAKNNTTKQISNPQQWFSGKTASLKWSEQGERLYFENRPRLAPKEQALKYKDDASLTDFDTIRAQKGLKIWHNNDPEIKTREVKTWEETNKHRHYQAVYHLNGERVAQLSDTRTPSIELNTEAEFLLVSNDQPYLEQIMYNGFYRDYYAVQVTTGAKHLIVKESPFTPSVSPTGQHALLFKDQHVWLKTLDSQKVSVLTKAIRDAIFADDKHDYPEPQPGYGFAGWQLDGSVAYVYSKYDIWAFDVNTLEATRLTQGKETQTQYRIVQLEDNKLGFASNETLFLSAHNLQNKQTHIATLALDSGKLTKVLSDAARFDLVKKAKHSDKVIFTKQSYHQFPDYWQTDTQFNTPQKVTDLNPQLSQFAWGQKPELVQYKGYNGEDLQGVLIKPANYKEGDQVPVVIYFYRYMSQRMYDFPKMELNHRPNFPMFTSNGYALFLPDIRFEIGHPGRSSTQTMINAAQKLIDIGVADPNRIGLQGHSWAGYQSAFMVTQTDMFKAVVSGAPVSNMTSAYSGIRLKSGLARQFQYESGQSRIGKTLAEAPELYIENSPVFFADKVNTPILIMFGDEDGAVPWQEGIQYYLALRRYNKDAIFLQYEGEPHHLKQFPNQLDFSIRMMEYFDHHLKGLPAANWIKQGEAYTAE